MNWSQVKYGRNPQVDVKMFVFQKDKAFCDHFNRNLFQFVYIAVCTKQNPEGFVRDDDRVTSKHHTSNTQLHDTTASLSA